MDTPFARSAAADPPLRHADARFHGTSGPIFALALRTGLLTLVTLGIYRFWAKTRIRRFVWSAIEIDGARFEYTGTGLEKFLGFLVAVMLLAVYLGVIQMALFFFGISLFREPESEAALIAQMAGVYVSALAVLPLIYFAIYRARRYKLARTRWRGIRFGMESAAWGYAFRALGYGFLAIVSLGLLLPLATFRLEQFMTDRSWFGNAQFKQEGRWQDLYRAMKHVLIGIGLVVLAAVAGISGSYGLAIFLGVLGVVWGIVGLVHYSVQSFAYLANHKVLGEEITFVARTQTSTVVLTYLVGTLAIGVLTGIAFAILALVTGAGAVIDIETFEGPGTGSLIFGVAGYLFILVAAGAGALAMITQPILAHYVNTITVENVDAIAGIVQRAHDEGADAEGFADALDIGGAL